MTEDPADRPTADDIAWLHSWTAATDIRLTAIEADTYDVADRLNLVVALSIVVILTLVGIGAMIVAVRWLS